MPDYLQEIEGIVRRLYEGVGMAPTKSLVEAINEYSGIVPEPQVLIFVTNLQLSPEEQEVITLAGDTIMSFIRRNRGGTQ